MPEWAFFIAKYFGSGIIIATAFIHLLAPAVDSLTDPCLTGPITEYDWAEGIALMTIFVLFFLELMVMRYAKFGNEDDGHGHTHSHNHGQSRQYHDTPTSSSGNFLGDAVSQIDGKQPIGYELEQDRGMVHMPGEDHHGHARDHTDNEDVPVNWRQNDVTILPEAYSAQLTGIAILEFGVIFHSIFVGLTLAVAGDEFKTLYVVIVFHQTFEGLGLGSRLASVPWPKSKRWTPYILAAAYGLTTPIAIAIGLGVRNTYPPGSATTLIVNGVFDSISAGILIYTGLVELMAHEVGPFAKRIYIEFR